MWMPGDRVPGDVADWLPEGVTNPTPPSSTTMGSHLFLVCCPPQVIFAYLLWPPDTEMFMPTAVDKSLELLE